MLHVHEVQVCARYKVGDAVISVSQGNAPTVMAVASKHNSPAAYSTRTDSSGSLGSRDKEGST